MVGMTSITVNLYNIASLSCLSALDEEFVNRTERPVSPDCPTPIGQIVGVITIEPFEE